MVGRTVSPSPRLRGSRGDAKPGTRGMVRSAGSNTGGKVCGVGSCVQGVCKSQSRKMIVCGVLNALARRHRKHFIFDLLCACVCAVWCGVLPWEATCACDMGAGGCGVCGLCGDQTTCVPTLASMGTRGFESWSIIWGKKNCIISPRG